MTSRNLFFKLLKEDLKKRTWFIVLFSLVLFIAVPVFCALRIENFTEALDEWKMDEILNYIGPYSSPIVLITIVAAIVCGLSGFYYLQSRKKVDLYHSIPARREILFAVNYVNGLLVYFIPFIINIVLSLIILRLNNLFSGTIFSAAMAGIIIHFIFYGMVYTTTIIAVMLTGNIIVSILGTGVFLVYGPVLAEIKSLFLTGFFSTYYTNYDSTETLLNLSPLGTYVNTVVLYSNGDKYQLMVIINLLITILLIGIALLLYKKRPSEAAGKALTYQVSKPIIKFMLVIPATLGGGIVFKNFVSSNSDAWYIFGLIFTVIIMHSIIQVIFDFDIRSILHNKRQLLACILISAAIACIFRFDLFHYDTYIPAYKDVESMSVSISEIDQDFNYFNIIDGEYEYIDSADYQLDKMKLTDFKAAYDLAEIGIKKSNKEVINSNSYMSQNDNYYNYIVKYSLKNGRKIYRQYKIKYDDSKEQLSNIYSNKEYKLAHNPLNQVEKEKITNVTIRYEDEILNYEDSEKDQIVDSSMSMIGQSAEELVTIYKEELNNLTLEEVVNSKPVAVLSFEGNQIFLDHNYVFPSFVKTIAYLQAFGFDTKKSLDINKISGIGVYCNRQNNYDESILATSVENNYSTDPVNYTDQKQIEELLPYLVNNEYYQDFNAVIEVDDLISVSVMSSSDLGENAQSYEYYFRKDQVPEFVKRDLGMSEQ